MLQQHPVWADLGAGTGLFTRALAAILGNDCTIYAVDRNAAALNEIEHHQHPGSIITVVRDFASDNLDLPLLDGVLMANALHFVKEKVPFLKRIHSMLKDNGRLIVVEYDFSHSNPWVPYPIAFGSLKTLLHDAGFRQTQKLSELPSRYQPANIYSAVSW